MDWLRRNWPDLLIGVALVAVIAGIIATLISGGSFFPIGPGNRNAGGATTTQSSGTTPGTSGTTVTPTTPSGATAASGATAPSDATSTTGQTQSGQTAGLAGTEGAGATSAGASTTGASTTTGADTSATQVQGGTTTEPAGTQDGGAIAVLPPGGQTTQTTTTTTPATSSGATAATTQTQGAATATQPASTPSGAGTAPANAAATATTGESSYRVAVGAFGNPDNAQRLANTFQAAGYPVLLGTQGNLTIVLVGPYDTEAQARSIADRVKAGNFGVTDATVYRYDPEGAGGTTAATTPATQTAQTTTAPTTPQSDAGATAPAQAAATSATAKYLQVGAYGSRQSALPQIERLQGLGFQVTERTEGTLLKLLVGPYEGAALNEAKARLDAAGIESFAR